EAGLHAYASRTGRYQSLTKWRYRDGELRGEFEGPIIVGVVGGVTRLHPTSQMCLRMLDIEKADDLSRICAAVGLVQNLGALKALTTVGIIEGHMKLHIKNLALGVGAQEKEMPMLQKKLEEFLNLHRRITLSTASDILKELRAKSTASSPTFVPHENA
ncbi:MAG: hydroxymethylglutaryl-CoA reductase, degradative, partial [Bdellovibrionales bacterium]|nr:hydroxymethylglutaryl-CoA reductase, degradative [Bdellovibrionales bacterium]